MQEQVHTGYGRSSEVFLLPINPTVSGAIIVHIANRFNKHTASSTRGIVYGFSCLG